MAEDARQNQLAEKASRELTTHTEAPLATRDQPVGMSGEPDQSDYVTPFLTLVQGTSKYAAEHKPGSFMLTSGQSFPSVEFVVVHIALTRTYYDNEAKELVCSSADRRTGNARKMEILDPDSQVTGRLVIDCTLCPHYLDSPWAKQCVKDYALTCVDVSTDEAFMYRVKGASTGLFRNKIINPSLRAYQPPWGAIWKMTGAFRQRDGNNWWEPELALVQVISDDDRESWASYASQFETMATPAVNDVDPDDLPFE
jgi:hypothetical protein